MITRFIGVMLLGFGLMVGCQSQEQEQADENYAEEMAEQHEYDVPEPSALVQEPLIPVESRGVAYSGPDGGEHIGYYAEPQRPDSVADAMGYSTDAPLPGLIVVHEWWGLNDNIAGMAERLAGEGFRVLAVDLYEGEVADTPDGAQSLMELALQGDERINNNLRGAYEYLTRNGETNVGVIGWCFGGTMSLRAATEMPTQLDAAVIYYGHISEADEEQLAALEMPILGFFGADDSSIPVENVTAFEETLLELDKSVDIHVYEDAGHAFANPSGGNYVEEAAEDAWDRTTAFLVEHLYGVAPEQTPISEAE